MTDWDYHYLNMRLPTNLDSLFPDPIGAIESLEDERFMRRVRWASRLIAVVIVVSTALAIYNFFPSTQWVFKLFWFQA